MIRTPPSRSARTVRRPRPAATAGERLLGVRRWLVLHRRPVSAALAFCSMLLALQVLAPGSASPIPTGAHSAAVSVDDDLLRFPLRLSDPTVTALLSPGDVVDVLGSELRGSTTVVARALAVVDVPQAAGGAFGSGEGGLVVLAVSEPGALDLAAAAARGPVTVAVHP